MELDHLAVAGESLEAAKAHVEEALGVPLQMGGQHAMFGTHNYLLGLADGLYLEAIAIDANATPQRSPCWFDLDRFSGAPRISNWICRTDNLSATLGNSPIGSGKQVALTRGNLKWDMAVPEDGILPYDNLFPALIQWHSVHPAPRLDQHGCSLVRLHLGHPKQYELADALAASGLSDEKIRLEYLETPKMVAEIMTPHGVRILE